MPSAQEGSDRRCRQFRLDDEAARAAGRNATPVVVRFTGRGEHDCRPVSGGERDGDCKPVAVWKLHVEQNSVGGVDGDRRQGLRRVPCFAYDDVARSLEQFSRNSAKGFVIVDDQHAQGHA
jgi:hypothetical protein